EVLDGLTAPAAAPPSPPEPQPGDFADAFEEAAAPDCDEAEHDKPPAPFVPKIVARPPQRRKGRLSYDDRTRIRTRYQAELESQQAKGFNRLPRGFVQAMAVEFGVTAQTIADIGRNRDSF
ncbi:MAG TPA: hypothetical protein VFV10_17200, partial [Gammaproteobacteria bacterium]|nr:hypothetical protein [Gammaproteobacteria bacterium]